MLRPIKTLEVSTASSWIKKICLAIYFWRGGIKKRQWVSDQHYPLDRLPTCYFECSRSIIWAKQSTTAIKFSSFYKFVFFIKRTVATTLVFRHYISHCLLFSLSSINFNLKDYLLSYSSASCFRMPTQKNRFL